MLRRLDETSVGNCFGKMIMERQKELGMDNHQAMFISMALSASSKLMIDGSLVETGSDTLRASLNAFIAGAVAQPAWTKRAREELDRVCGEAKRLPTFGDIENLPFIQAAVKESLRWRPLVEAGVNHMATEDFQFEQYYFPKGTLFTWNAWAINQNPEEYRDPELFLPERFLDENVDNPLFGLWSFGAGRRGMVLTFISLTQQRVQDTQSPENFSLSLLRDFYIVLTCDMRGFLLCTYK
jgi:cytochrome P450